MNSKFKKIAKIVAIVVVPGAIPLLIGYVVMKIAVDSISLVCKDTKKEK